MSRCFPSNAIMSSAFVRSNSICWSFSNTFYFFLLLYLCSFYVFFLVLCWFTFANVLLIRRFGLFWTYTETRHVFYTLRSSESELDPISQLVLISTVWLTMMIEANHRLLLKYHNACYVHMLNVIIFLK